MKKQVCIVPKVSGLGGMVSFHAKFIQGLQARQIPYSLDLSDPNNTVVLVIGGTRQLWKLWRAKQRGVSIVQRLNGMNWLHKVQKTPLRAFLKAELNNYLLAIIRRYLADRIVYQSEFSRDWWDQVYGEIKVPTQVIYNGVDLKSFSPNGPEIPPPDHDRILLVEGHLDNALARGLETAIKLAQTIKRDHARTIELMVVADVGEDVIARTQSMAPDCWITWKGVLPQAKIPSIERSAHVLFSADLNAACPNSVIEALACGLPVLAYDTGSLGELVQKGAGKVVPYGSNYWKLEEPDLGPLANACVEIIQNNPSYRLRARSRAENTFSLDAMMDAYLGALVV